MRGVCGRLFGLADCEARREVDGGLDLGGGLGPAVRLVGEDGANGFGVGGLAQALEAGRSPICTVLRF